MHCDPFFFCVFGSVCVCVCVCLAEQCCDYCLVLKICKSINDDYWFVTVNVTLLILCIFWQSVYSPANALNIIQLIPSNETPSVVPKHEGVLILVIIFYYVHLLVDILFAQLLTGYKDLCTAVSCQE